MAGNGRVGTGVAVGLSLLLGGCVGEIENGSDVASDTSSLGFMPGQYVVYMRESARLDTAAYRFGVTQTRTLPARRALVVRDVTEQKLAALLNDPDVLAVYPDAIAHVDGKPGSSGGGGTTGQVVPAGVDRTGTDETSHHGAGAVVCIADSGIDYGHADLSANYVDGYDFVNGDADPMDDHGHGTHVAGTVAAANNTVDVVGVAPAASLLAAKVIGADGSGAYSGIIAGIDYCVAQGADVINMSLGGAYDDPGLHQAIIDAVAAGVTVVVAAGNSGLNLDVNDAFPANYPEVITVSAACGKNRRFCAEMSRDVGTEVAYPSFTNYNGEVDITAPGVKVVSTKLGGGTTSMDGTSMASPHVAGAAAVYIGAHPGASPNQVRSALLSNTEDVNGLTGYYFGELVNVRGL